MNQFLKDLQEEVNVLVTLLEKFIRELVHLISREGDC